MTLRSSAIDIKLELKVRLLPILAKDFTSHKPININFFHIETKQLGWSDEWKSVSAEELFSVSRPDKKIPKAWVIAGNGGAGKTALARSILQSWLTNSNIFTFLSQYEAVLIVDGEDLIYNKTQSQIQYLLPDATQRWGLDRLLAQLKDFKTLFLIDGIFPEDTDHETKLCDFLKEWKEAEILLFTNLIYGPRIMELTDLIKPSVYIRFSKTNAQLQYSIAQEIITNFNSQNLSLLPETFFKHYKILWQLFENLGGLRDYILFLSEFSDANWKTLTSFLWDSVYRRLDVIQRSHSLSKYKLDEWLMIAGERCLACLARGIPFFGKEALPLFEVTSDLFPEILDPSLLFEAIFKSHHSLHNNEIVVSVCHHMQQEVLAAFYLLKKNMDGMPLKRLLRPIKRDDVYDSLSFHVAALLSKLITEGNKFFHSLDSDHKRREKIIQRVLKNLSLQRDLSPDPTTFTLRIMRELDCSHPLINIFLKDAVFGAYLYVHEEGMYSNPLEILLKNEPLKKLHLLLDREHRVSEIKDILHKLKDYEINLALMDMGMVQWENEGRNDELIKILLSTNSVKLQDFIGCLDQSTINKLHLNDSLRHLVCLRVRVCNKIAAVSLIQSQNLLPHLMWLEIDFDFLLSEVLKLTLPTILIPLIDFSFRDVKDSDIENLCDFLYSASRRYAGLHIHRSSVSPRGVTELLKYFFRRSMCLTADEKDILKYRKYRFPELSTVSPSKLEESEIEWLLGYADRHHYSDNEVKSSCVSNYDEVNSLKHFLVLIETIYFVYSCANFHVIKETNGNCYVKQNLIT